ncbi:hypothetical protein [Almyronema epifaneia]|uniref:Leucine-rich repeat domain-containing protein n=1 Tax=Almyronema epifaneia S1 TaxID=2991925 RepID=A0ABW6IHF3_9CYAN
MCDISFADLSKNDLRGITEIEYPYIHGYQQLRLLSTNLLSGLSAEPLSLAAIGG